MNSWLAFGAALSAIAALLHIGIIVGGPAWYRFFGAGERMARAAERGSGKPGFITAGIALVLFGWSAYGLAGAGVIPRLPLLPAALCAITAVYLLRGLVLVPAVVFARGKVTPFLVWSSGICFGFGIVHLVGLVQVWASL
jgi:hypothetical protein